MTAQITTRTIEKAGVVPFTPGGSVIICTSLSDPTKWVLPKGHCDEVDTLDLHKPKVLETHAVTAVREAREEIGWNVNLIDPTPVGEVTRFLYDEKDDRSGKVTPVYEHVVYFAAEITSRVSDGERPILQVGIIQALTNLSFPDVKEILLKAHVAREIIRYLNVESKP